MSDLVKIAKIEISNSNKLCIIAGLNVLEDDQLTFKVAERLKKITEAQGNSFIFKASFDKANRSSVDSCLLYTSPSPRDTVTSRMPSSA